MEFSAPKYDLELRCAALAMAVRKFCRSLGRDTINLVYIKQVIRSSSSVGANYIEANEHLGKQDLKMKIKISRKEAQETQYWLQLLITDNEEERARPLSGSGSIKKNIISHLK